MTALTVLIVWTLSQRSLSSSQSGGGAFGDQVRTRLLIGSSIAPVSARATTALWDGAATYRGKLIDSAACRCDSLGLDLLQDAF